MKYSFIIPVYNSENSLEACVQSILSQNVSEFELLLIDDGSEDSSPALCDRLAQQHSEVKAFHQPNGGVSSARNRGIREATGDYLLFVDSDDVLLPFSNNIWDILENGQPDCLIFGMRFQYLHNGKAVREEEMCVSESQWMDVPALGQNFRELFIQNCFSSSCNKFYKKTLLTDEHMFFDTGLTVYEDLVFSLRFIPVCTNIYVSSEIGYLYLIDESPSHMHNRMTKIDDVIARTDIIANAFWDLERRVQLPEATKQICISVYDVYMIQFWRKVKTLPIHRIGQLCDDFCNNSNILNCLQFIPTYESERNPMFRLILNRAVLQIWLHVRYRRFRNVLASTVKRILKCLR